MENQFIVTFTKEKETKNTIRFQDDINDGQPPCIGSLYIQKWVISSGTKVKVTVVILD